MIGHSSKKIPYHAGCSIKPKSAGKSESIVHLLMNLSIHFQTNHTEGWFRV